ncbi:hypothetical protein TIFTF001_030484 [Ficus carica]|uniref:Uncharacterized protein n=1 Tax=Ficus carica TaxID=3494 RepID=A0AA88DTH0_FICCA|nr:hypothetical protein TIFTF001_030484 [Ficus carica]
MGVGMGSPSPGWPKRFGRGEWVSGRLSVGGLSSGVGEVSRRPSVGGGGLREAVRGRGSWGGRRGSGGYFAGGLRGYRGPAGSGLEEGGPFPVGDGDQRGKSCNLQPRRSRGVAIPSAWVVAMLITQTQSDGILIGIDCDWKCDMVATSVPTRGGSRGSDPPGIEYFHIQ